MDVLRSQLDARDASDPNLHTILGRLEMLVNRQEERIQALEGQLEWVQNHQALCPCIWLRTLASVREGSEEGMSNGSGEEVPTVVNLSSCLHDSGRELSLGVRGGDSHHGGLGSGTG